MTDRVGQQVGNYHLVRLLGTGGFAEVYLGEHVYLKTPAAIKLLLTKVAHQADLNGFLKEAQTIAQLVHPHIVRVMDFGLDGETPFLVMDYARGGTLRDRYPRGSPLPLQTIIPYVKHIAEALQYAHEEKFIHRDVKPENMLVGRRDTVLLSDFGIALIAQSSRYQSTQEVIGTVAYMSPEQIQGKPRPASDQYSLGIVVYEWLCGDKPFHGSFTELCTQQMFASPPPLHEKMSTLSPTVEQVVMRALAKDPHQRFGSVQDFATALELASQLEPTMTIPASHSSQPTEIAPAPNESFISTELVTPPSQSALAPTIYAQSSPAASALPPIQIASATPPVGTVHQIYHDHSEGGIIRVVAWSPDSKYIASIAENIAKGWYEVRVWEVTTGHTHFTHPCLGEALAWSPDGRRVIFFEFNFIAYEVATQHKMEIANKKNEFVSAIAWSPDGARIASGGPKTVRVLDAVTGKIILTYHGHSNQVTAVAWSPDGSRIASSGLDKIAQVWDVVQGRTIWTATGLKNIAAWSPDGRHIVLSVENHIVVYDAATGEPILPKSSDSHTPYSTKAIAWSPDSKRIASGYSSTVQVWDAFTGANAFIYRGHSDPNTAFVSLRNPIRAVAWSPDGTRIASGDSNNTVHVWQAPSC